MAPKRATTTTTTAAPVATPVESTESHSKKTTKRVQKVTPAPEPEPTPEPVAVEPVAEESGAKANVPVAASAEEVISVLNQVVQVLKNNIVSAKARKDKETSSSLSECVKTLNSLRKPIDKIAKSKPVRKTVNIDTNRNGFMKPVQISAQLADFLGCSADELRSRVQVTTALCDYIRDHDLQNPENRREIRVDAKLGSLLSYDPTKETVPLTYYGMQSRIQPHFIRTTA